MHVKTGVALFTDGTETKGWCSFMGERPAPFSSLKLFSESHIILTNLKKVPAHGPSCLKNSSYLGLSLFKITEELGLSIELAPRESVRILSEVLTRTINHVETLVGELGKPDNSILEAILSALELDKDDPIETSDVFVSQCINSGYEETRLGADGPKTNSIPFSVRLPRCNFYKEVLNTNVPTGDWKLINNEKLPVRNADTRYGKMSKVYRFLEDVESSVSAMVEVQVKPGCSQMKGVLSSYINAPKPIWLPCHEALVISEFANVQVNRLILAGSQVLLREKLGNLPMNSDTEDKVSYSYGLALRIVTSSLSSPRVRNVFGDYKEYATSQDVWVRGYERAVSLIIAKHFVDKGFRVHSFGNGGITIWVSEEEMKSFIRNCMELELPLPLSVFHGLNKNTNSAIKWIKSYYDEIYS